MPKHTRPLNILIITKANPAGPPIPGPTLTIEAPASSDGLHLAAQVALIKQGYQTHRAICFSATGLTAYVEVP